MKNQKARMRLLIIAIVLLIIGVGILLFSISKSMKNVIIYDFARTIEYDEKSNYALQESDICEAEISEGDVREEYIVNKDEIIGKYITGTAYKNQHVLRTQLQTDPTYIDKSGIDELAGYRKIYLQIDYSKGFAGDIAAGQMVDLAYTETGAGFTDERTEEEMGINNSIQFASAKIFMQNVPIYQVYTADGSIYVKRDTTPTTLGVYNHELSSTDGEEVNYVAPAYVCLTVTGEQFEEIEARRQLSTITLVSRFDTSSDIETEGYTVIKDSYAHYYTGEGNLEYDHEIDEVTEELEEESENGTKKTEEETQPVKKTEGLYTFLKGLTKIQMNEDQLNRFNTIYTKYAEYMESYAGTEWELNEPDLVKYSDLLANIDISNSDEINAFMGWKEDIETLAKELRGSGVRLPFD